METRARSLSWADADVAARRRMLMEEDVQVMLMEVADWVEKVINKPLEDKENFFQEIQTGVVLELETAEFAHFDASRLDWGWTFGLRF